MRLWTTIDAGSGSRVDLLRTARFLIRYCHIGALGSSCDTEEWVERPWRPWGQINQRSIVVALTRFVSGETEVDVEVRSTE